MDYPEVKNIILRKIPLQDEPSLLLQMAGGDEKAFAEVFHFYRNKIYAYAFHLFGNADMADELVQDVFLKVWLNREKIPPIVRFDAWLFIIARNQVFTSLKGMAKEIAAKKRLGEREQAGSNNVENQLINKENEQLLRSAISRLSPQQKLIFTLSRTQGLKHGEIASRLNISHNTVKTHLVHAIKILRNTLPLHSDSILLLYLFFHYL
jgi:RNA polymerase sigma-70 factor (ECF subfamily)